MYSIPPEGKIEIHQRKAQFCRTLERLKIDASINSENKQLILDFVRDCTLGKTVKGKSKKKIGPARCLKYIDILTLVSNWFGESFNAVTETSMEKIIEALEADQFKSRTRKPFADETKADIKKTIKKFWKWKDGDNSHYPGLVQWIDISVPHKEIPAISRDEVEKLIESTPGPRQKALLMVLFDSGARIEELLNVRIKPEHVYWKEEIGCYMIRLEYSKTKPRTISLPLSTKYLRSWLQNHPYKDNPLSQLFPVTYASLRVFLNRLGKKILQKRVSPHLLRHSSATYYANKLNHYQLCYRYGWTMSSDMVTRYIDRAGIIEQQTAGIVTKSEIEMASSESRQLKEQVIQLREANEQLMVGLNSVKTELQLLKDGKGLMKLLMSIRLQKKEIKSRSEN